MVYAIIQFIRVEVVVFGGIISWYSPKVESSKKQWQQHSVAMVGAFYVLDDASGYVNAKTKGNNQGTESQA